MAAKFVNIRRDVDDKFYRYRMPVLQTKIEGKGNGIKTVLPNMADVARALSRPATYPTKFFGIELGAQTLFEKNERYIVNGAHDAERLRELLHVFIDKFVLCGDCKNPETDLLIQKNKEARTEVIIRDCKACGSQTMVNMQHKLILFILKNPPATAKKSKSGRKGADASAGGGGAHATANGSPVDDEGSGASSGDELSKRFTAEAAELTAEPTMKDDDWSVDISAEAVAARLKLLGGDDDDAEDDVNSDKDDPYEQLRHWVEANRDTLTAESVYQHTVDMGIDKKHKTIQVLAESLFTKDMMSEVGKYAKDLFAKMIGLIGDHREKHEKALLGGLERFIGKVHPELVPEVSKILMAFYQADALDEELLKHWGTHVSKKYVDAETSKIVRKSSRAFLDWLEEADEESSDEE